MEQPKQKLMRFKDFLALSEEEKIRLGAGSIERSARNNRWQRLKAAKAIRKDSNLKGKSVNVEPHHPSTNFNNRVTSSPQRSTEIHAGTQIMIEKLRH